MLVRGVVRSSVPPSREYPRFSLSLYLGKRRIVIPPRARKRHLRFNRWGVSSRIVGRVCLLFFDRRTLA